MQLIKSYLVISIIGMALAMQGCSSNADTDSILESVPLPPDAYDVRTVELGRQAARQLFFRVDRKYPSKEPLTKIGGYLEKSGWISCSNHPRWDAYEDRSSNDALLVYEYTRYWLSPSHNSYMITSGRYYSQTGFEKKGVPDNNTQNIIIWISRDSNPEKALKNLGVSCEGHG